MGDGEGNSHLRRRRRRSYPTSSNNHVLLAAIALYVVAVLLCPPLEVSADPETVEGMYLEKKDGGGKAANSLRRQKSGNGFNSNPKKPPSAPSFRQGYMGFESGVSGRRAFGQVRRPRPVAKEGFNNVPPPWLRKQQHQPHDSPNQVKSNNNLNRGMQKTSAPFYTSSSSIDLKPKPTIPASTTTSPPSAAASIGTTAYRDLNQVNGALHHDQNVTPGNLDVSPPASTSGPNQLPPVDKKAATKDASSSSSDNPPRAAFLAEDKNGDGNAPAESAKGSTSSSVFTGQDRHKAIVGLVIGVAFVVIFIAMGIGLAAQCVMDKVKGQGGGGRNIFSNLRTPNEEDRTPPELRGNGGAPTFVQPKNYDIGNGIGTGSGGHMNGGCGRNGVGQPFFTSKLILQDAPPSHGRGVRSGSGGNTSMTSTLFATHAAAIMPSPAEQVTDDLVSPKYDTEEDDATEEDDSDDTVYECPGLAAPGQEMVVSNPFFLQGRQLAHLQRQRSGDHGGGAGEVGGSGGSGVVGGGGGPGVQQPKPISEQSNLLFHHGIKGVN